MKIKLLSDQQIDNMFELYSLYYGGATKTIFIEDLNKKDRVIFLTDEHQKVQGFSTVQTIHLNFDNKPINVLFSGDTIVHHQYWGKNDLSQEWVKYAGTIKHQAPDIPLYWFLIVKGHRTYRYLSTFSHTYYPAPYVETPAAEKKLMEQLSTKMFGEAYDKQKGIIHFPNSRGHLKDKWGEISQKDLRLCEVRFFLEKNPNYLEGDELVCLCELKAENLRSFGRRLFVQSQLPKELK